MLHVSPVVPSLCVYLQKYTKESKITKTGHFNNIFPLISCWLQTKAWPADKVLDIIYFPLCVCVMRSHNSVYSKLDTKQWTIVWCTLSAHVRTAEVSARLLQHFIITLSVSLNAMRVTLLPTVRTVHALHQLTTQQTPWPSGNWEVQGSIPDLPSLATVLFVFHFRRVRITMERRMQLCHSVRPSGQQRFNEMHIQWYLG